MNLRTFLVGVTIAVWGVAAQACEILDVRVCAIVDHLATDEQAGIRVRLKQDFSLVPQGSTAALEWVIGGPDHLLVGETRQLSDQALFFVLAHELGHAKLQHGRKLLEGVATESDRTLPDLALLTQYRAVLAEERAVHSGLHQAQEIEADSFAVRLMVSHSMNVERAMREVLHSAAASYDHPSRYQRISNARRTAAALRDSIQLSRR